MKKLLTIFSVLALGALFALQTANTAQAGRPNQITIVDTVVAPDGEFDVLQAAVVKAGLVDALNGNRQLTVFAPTDQAFIKTLGVANEADAIQAVENLNTEDLQNILLYHVANGRRISNSVLAAPQYRMLNGDFLTRTELLDAGINSPNIPASNGIIHVIDAVLLP